MKDKTSRVLAIIALVTMGIFVGTLIATLVDYTLLNNAIGFIALGSGVFTLMIFIALKADGRGFSMTKINNEIEMQKIEKKAAEQAEREKAEKSKSEIGEANVDNEEPAEGSERSDCKNEENVPDATIGDTDGDGV